MLGIHRLHDNWMQGTFQRLMGKIVASKQWSKCHSMMHGNHLLPFAEVEQELAIPVASIDCHSNTVRQGPACVRLLREVTDELPGRRGEDERVAQARSRQCKIGK